VRTLAVLLLTATASAAPGALAGEPAAAAKPRPDAPAAAGAQTRPARKVWTNADLEALRRDPSARLTVLESKAIGRDTARVHAEPSVSPQDVVDRYQALVAEAERKLGDLERERLAGINPFLRGLASQTGGPRPADQVQADLERWRGRRDAARDNLERARKLTGSRPQPSPVQPAPDGP
jgi:hypothetical protein